MALIEFKDYPSTDAPINAENLNNNFNELETNLETNSEALNTKLDELIETGNNENGNWIKYGDGTMVCYNTVRVENISTSGTIPVSVEHVQR